MNVQTKPERVIDAAGIALLPLTDTPHQFAFLLLDGFSLLSFTSAVETLHIANRAAGRKVFDWVTLSETGAPVMTNQGTSHKVTAAISRLKRQTTLLVCGGDMIETATSKRILAWLREQAVHGCHVGGLCTAAWTLAEAGLLTSARATIHWENTESFAETFPLIALTDAPFVLDGNRSSTAGGTAAIDLVLELIARLADRDLAIATSEKMLYGSIHKLQENFSIAPCHRIGLANPRLRRAIALMDENLDEGISTDTIADDVGVSVRQLERQFRQHLKQSPQRYLTSMRLDRAKRLLVQTDMTIIGISFAAGYSSQTHFSKVFRERFGRTPYQLRSE